MLQPYCPPLSLPDSLPSSAGAAGVIASGANASATRANQVALGSSASTYTFAGIGSAASSAAQSGDVGFVTSDAGGNLALSDFGPNDILALDNALRRDRRDARAGIATAMAMG